MTSIDGSRAPVSAIRLHGRIVGSVLEGETLLVLAGLAARRGYLSLQWVVVVAATGAFIGDQICFFVGRRLNPRSGAMDMAGLVDRAR